MRTNVWTRWRFVVAVVPLAGLILACGGAGSYTLTSDRSPSWACPSPMPLPYDDAGPVKEYRDGDPDPTTGVPEQVPVFYQQWEQEYGVGGSLLGGWPPFDGPPFPSPTPYTMVGTRYAFGQRVRVEPLFALVTARQRQAVGDRQLYLIELRWRNPTNAEIPIDYGTQVRLSAVLQPDGRTVMGETWYVSKDALVAAGASDLPATISPGDSEVVIPILGPPGEPQTVDVLFLRDAAGVRALTPTSTGTAPAAGPATPTPNSGLRQAADPSLIVQWSKTELRIGPPCAEPGAITDLDTGGGWGNPAVPIVAPAGASRVVQIALNQVGKAYIWGDAGPESFDCSGLMMWAYAQVGIRIPRTTNTQWPKLRAISPAEMQPGDMVYFDTRTAEQGFRGVPEQITHVAMVADLDGDGAWDIIHAANPRLGVRTDYGFLTSAYYRPRMFPTARTVR